ncbi:MAG: tetratricopeptide repeat protein, partial [Opitutales bacterium]
AFELFAYYTPLSILCVSCAFALHKLSSKLGITMGMLRIVALYTTAGIFSIFSFTFALEVRNPQNMWQSIARQWPESSQAQIAYLESIVSQKNNELRKDKLILMMQALLEKEPDRLEIRKLMARTMQEANQPNNALREYRRILREGTDDIAFMEEAADFLEFRNLSFEAEKVRQRIQQLQEAAADTPLE